MLIQIVGYILPIGHNHSSSIVSILLLYVCGVAIITILNWPENIFSLIKEKIKQLETLLLISSALMTYPKKIKRMCGWCLIKYFCIVSRTSVNK